ncbi:MAG: hypothetical protein ACK5HO_08050 [Pseudomonadota bacterium]
MPVLLARTFARHYSVLQKSVAKSRVLENAIDSRMLIKATTYSDVQQKPCQFYWHGLLHVTIRSVLSHVICYLEQRIETVYYLWSLTNYVYKP